MKKSYFLFRYFSDKGLNFPYQLFDSIGNVKSWSSIKEEFGFSNFSNFEWQQLMYVLPPFLKKNNKRNVYCWQSITPKSPLYQKKSLVFIQGSFTLSLYTPILLHQDLRSILSNYLKLAALTGNIFIFYHVWYLLTVILVTFNIRSWTIFFI